MLVIHMRQNLNTTMLVQLKMDTTHLLTHVQLEPTEYSTGSLLIELL